MDARVVAGRYRLGPELGRGASGTVYLATRLEDGLEAAVKLLHPHLESDERSVHRFLREAEVTGRLDHDNIVKVVEAGRDEGGTLFLAMERLAGRTLSERVAAGDWPDPAEALRIAAEVCDALTVAHRLGVIHRDLKPGNIFLAEDADGAMRAKVLDFGLARLVQAGVSVSEPTEEISGTPAYMSPEQILGRKVDARADLYAVGVVLYELLAHEHPFGRGSLIQTCMNHLEAKPARLVRTGLAAAAERAVAELVEGLLAKEPEERPERAGQVRTALLGALASGAVSGRMRERFSSLAASFCEPTPAAAPDPVASVEPLDSGASARAVAEAGEAAREEAPAAGRPCVVLRVAVQTAGDAPLMRRTSRRGPERFEARLPEGLGKQLVAAVRSRGGRTVGRAGEELACLFEGEDLRWSAAAAVGAALSIRETVRSHRSATRDRLFVRTVAVAVRDGESEGSASGAGGAMQRALRQAERILRRAPLDGVIVCAATHGAVRDLVVAEPQAAGAAGATPALWHVLSVAQ